MEKIATRDAYGKALVKLGEKFQDLVVMDADLSKSTKTAEFAETFPERFINAGIAEQNMMGMAAGLAACGKTVFASTFAIFAAGRAFEQVRNSIAYSKLNVKIAATHAGVTVGEDGGSHQAVEDIALMRAIPNMKVVVPADATSVYKAMELLCAEEGPFYLRLGRPAVPVLYGGGQEFQIGRGIEIIAGRDATIVTCGIMVDYAVRAARVLESQGIRVGVVDMHTIKPIDEELLIKCARETGAILTVEEHSIIGGLGGAVCEAVSGNYPVPVVRRGIPDVFGQSGKPEELLAYYGLSEGQVVADIHRLLKIKAN